MNLGKYDVFIFDLDGTITDSSEGIFNSIIYALDKMGIKEVNRKELVPFIGPPLRDSFKKYFDMNDEDAKRAVSYYREYYSAKGVYELSMYEGVDETLKGLKSHGKRIMLGTSKPEIYAFGIIDKLGIGQYFDFLAGGDLEGKRDQKEDVLSYGLEQMGNPARDKVLMIGDTKFDVIGANKLGIDTLGVSYGFGSMDELKNAGAKWIVDSPEDIKIR